MSAIPTSLAPRTDLLERAARVRAVAAIHADAADRDARFPVEALAALKHERLLSAHVPRELGGESATLEELVAICAELGRADTSVAMAYAMHQIQVGCVVRHGLGHPWFDDYLRALAKEQRLIASATSELGVGGDLRTSKCAVNTSDGVCRVEKQASVISYGAYTDDILVTARRDESAAPGDQSIFLVRRDQCDLEKVSGWDTLGMRATESNGFVLRATFSPDQILPASFADVASQTMVAYSHVLWTGAWLGVAREAVSRARKCVQGEARKTPGKVPPSALRLAEVTAKLHTMTALVDDGRREYERRLHDADSLASFSFVVRINDLKLATSELMVEIVAGALKTVGIVGFRNDTKFAMGRLLRDAYGSTMQITNERIYGTNAQLLLMTRED